MPNFESRKTGIFTCENTSYSASIVEPLLTDTFLIRTVHLVPGKYPYILCKNNLHNTDPLSYGQRTWNLGPKENSYKLNLFIMDTPMMTVLIQHDFLFVVTYQSVINCLIVRTITVSFVFNQKILYCMLVFATLVTVLLCYCSETVIVCLMFLELYSLYCNDLYCPLNNLKAPQRLAWASLT